MASKKTPERLLGGIDIGGTKLYAVIATPEGKVLGAGKKKTRPEKGAMAVLDRAVEALDLALKEAGIEREDLQAVGVGAPSPILPDGTAVDAPNLGWKNLPLVKTLRERLGCPVFAENDCNAGTLGEYALGAGKGSKMLVGLFMGTGLGGGIVRHGELLVGENCMAAEVGHMVMQMNGRPCSCGKRGCLEAYASKVGMAYRLKQEILCEGRSSVLEELTGGAYANVKSSLLAKAYKGKDAVTVETLHEAMDYLGTAAGDLITVLGPDMIVLGGGVFEALGAELIGRVRTMAERNTHPAKSYKDTTITIATLGDDAVALGAMVYACQCLEAGRA